MLHIKCHLELARFPTCGSERAAGYNLYSAEVNTVPTHGQSLIDTHISITIPEGTYGRVTPWSRLTSKFSLHIGGGVINPDYCSTSCVPFNLNVVDFKIGVGDCIAQLVLKCITTTTITEDPELEMPTLNPFNLSGQGSSSANGATFIDPNCSSSPYQVTNPATLSSLAWNKPPTSLLM